MINHIYTNIPGYARLCGEKINTTLDSIIDITVRVLPSDIQQKVKTYKTEAKIMTLWMATSAMMYETFVCFLNPSVLNVSSAVVLSMTAIPLFLTQTTLCQDRLKEETILWKLKSTLAPTVLTTAFLAGRCLLGYNSDLLTFLCFSSVNLTISIIASIISLIDINDEMTPSDWAEVYKKDMQDYQNLGSKLLEFIYKHPVLLAKYQKTLKSDIYIIKKDPVKEEDYNLDDEYDRYEYFSLKAIESKFLFDELKLFLQRDKDLWNFFKEHVLQSMRQNDSQNLAGLLSIESSAKQT